MKTKEQKPQTPQTPQTQREQLMSKIIQKVDNETLIILATAIVALFIIVGVSTNDSQESINAKAGLEECVIQNVKDRQHSTYVKIWVKDCVATVSSIQNKKIKIKIKG